MPEEILKVVIAQLIDRFSPLAKNRGQRYFKEGRTQNVAINFQKMLLTADIKDERRPYAVRVHFNMEQEALSVSQSCTCQTENCCKHIYAALLAAQSVLIGNASPAANISTTAPADENTAPLLPPVTPLPLNLSPALNDWVLKVEQQNKAPAATAENGAVKENRKLIWRLVLNEVVNPSLCLSLEVVRFLGSGEPSPSAPQTCCLADLLRSYSTTAAIKALMDEKDWSLLTALAKTYSESLSYSIIDLSQQPSIYLLRQLIDTQRCFLQDVSTSPLQWGNSLPATITWELNSNGTYQRPICRCEDPQVLFFIKGDEPFYIDKDKFLVGPLHFEAPLALVKALLSAPPVLHTDIEVFQNTLAERFPSLAAYAPPVIQKRTLQVKPTICMRLGVRKKDLEERVVGILSFDYAGERLPLEATDKEIIYKTTAMVHKGQGTIINIERSATTERQAVKILLMDLRWDFYIAHEQGRYQAVFRSSGRINFMQEIIATLTIHKKELERRGWVIEIEDSLPFHQADKSDEFFLETASGSDWQRQDWFDVQLGAYINGERVNLLPALIALTRQDSNAPGSFLTFLEEKGPDTLYPLQTDDRRIVMIPVGRINAILEILTAEINGNNTILNKDGHLQIERWNAGILAELAKAQDAAQMRWIGPESLYTFAERVQGKQGLTPIPSPAGLRCTLRTYQNEGLNWLQFLHACNLNGILADDMGLGKTVQTLAHILVEKENGRMRLPALVIAPTSLMPNWRAEIERLAPSLSVLTLQGMNRHQYFDQIAQHDVILTTYPLLMRDKETLLAHRFHLLILDEAQAIKNSDTQAYQIVQQIKANHRLCLTGTPMENHLGELWSLFNFLMPGFLGDKKTFQNVYRKPIEKGEDEWQRRALIQRVKPFILRRTKQLVATELPEKTEIIQRIELGPQQRDLYEAIRLKAQADLMRHIEEKGLARSQIAVLDALLKLRQVCCDPRLLKAEKRPFEADSAKLEFLMDILPQMMEENRKILIFSQFTSMLALIQKELDALKITYTLLTGDTNDRQTPVNRFQQGDVPVMLLSLKAGGVGLNLTAADTVILFDPWWNPAVEDQAADRAHRLGQTKAVFVYKLVTSGTVEEKILALQEFKREMAAAFFDDKEGSSASFSMEDLANIFAPLPEIR